MGLIPSNRNGNNYRHGYTVNGNMTPEYRSWAKLKSRCLNINDKAYSKYGGRGLKVCDRWMEFQEFLNDMGEKPSDEHSIERINNDLGYSLENCKWATKKEQANNRRSNRYIQIGDEKKTMTQWANDFNVDPRALWKAMKRGSLARVLIKWNKLPQKVSVCYV